MGPLLEQIRKLKAEADEAQLQNTNQAEAVHAAHSKRQKAKKAHDQCELAIAELEKARSAQSAKVQNLQRRAAAALEVARQGLPAGAPEPDVTDDTEGARARARALSSRSGSYSAHAADHDRGRVQVNSIKSWTDTAWNDNLLLACAWPPCPPQFRLLRRRAAATD